MDKKEHDRRPGEKPAEQTPGKHDPNRPESGRKTPGAPEGDKGFGKPEGQPIDKQTPFPGRVGGREGERSDRESGRPVQLEDDDKSESAPNQGGTKPGLGGRPQEGREGQHEAEKKSR